MTSGIVFAQYASKTLNWTIATTGYVASVEGFVTLCVIACLAVVTPILKRRLPSRSSSLDVYILLMCLFFLAFGATLVGLARKVAVLIAGLFPPSAIP